MPENPFPINISEKEDSFEKDRLLANVDPRFKYTAEEFNLIIRALNFLYSAAGDGSGDMLRAIYDPNNRNGDVFSMGNMQETETAKVFTAAERASLGNIISYYTNKTDKGGYAGTTQDVVNMISDFEALKVDKSPGKQLSDENYTLGEKQKLAGLESSKWLGLYPTLTALQNAHPTAEAGNYADVDAGTGVDTIRYVWDVSDNVFIRSGSGAPLTPAQIKLMYESNLDTNAFTDDEKSKLASITAIFTTALKTAYDNTVTWISTNGQNILNHITSESNPHNVTKTQIGLGNVPNIDFSSKLSDVEAGDMVSIDKSNPLVPIINALSQFLEITQEDYDNLPVKNPNIIYIILPVEVPNLYILNDVCQPGSSETETIGVDWVVFEDAILSIASGSDSDWSLKATAEESIASVGGSVRLTVRGFEVGEQYRVTMDSRSTDDTELLAGQSWFEARPAGGFAVHRFFDIVSFDWEQHSIIVEPASTECFFSLFVSYTSEGPQTGWSCYLDNIVIEKIS
ncbi:MAG TPA: hypothetical protein VLY84_00155 [Dysgonamonadaceae bacterium]|nr:hypothetical protein [Dysgonamonadaceae bacterium]